MDLYKINFIEAVLTELDKINAMTKIYIVAGECVCVCIPVACLCY